VTDPEVAALKTAPKVRWVRRAEWHAKTPRAMSSRRWGNATGLAAVDGVTFHHTTGATFGPPDRLDDWVRQIQAYHMSGEHEHTEYDDIAYNALIGYDGSIFEGRANWARGGHARSRAGEANQRRLGVAYLGMGDQLTDAARAAFRAYVYVVIVGVTHRPVVVDRHFDWIGRGGTPTECCGHGALAALANELTRK
jgi:hypothetical protein